MPKYPASLIRKIKRQFTNRHWLKKTLAQRAGVDAGTISNLFKGNPVSPETMGSVLEALGITEPIYSDLPSPRTEAATGELVESAKTYPDKRLRTRAQHR